MKNAHERFGKLVYRRRTEKTATNLRVFLDAFVGEDRGKAYLVSVVGGDVEIGALAAAFANGDSFTVVDPYGEESIVSLGEKPNPTAVLMLRRFTSSMSPMNEAKRRPSWTCARTPLSRHFTLRVKPGCPNTIPLPGRST